MTGEAVVPSGEDSAALLNRHEGPVKLPSKALCGHICLLQSEGSL